MKRAKRISEKLRAAVERLWKKLIEANQKGYQIDEYIREARERQRINHAFRNRGGFL